MAQADGMVKGALRYLDGHFEDFKRTLVDMSRVPSVSADGFPPAEVRRSAESVAAALRAIVSDRERARAMGAAGRRRAETEFSPERSVETVEAAYREVLEAAR